MPTVINDEVLRGSVSANVTRLREARGLSQDQLAEMAGVHRVQINRIERGKSLPSLALTYTLADIFGIDANVFRQATEARREKSSATGLTTE